LRTRYLKIIRLTSLHRITQVHQCRITCSTNRILQKAYMGSSWYGVPLPDCWQHCILDVHFCITWSVQTLDFRNLCYLAALQQKHLTLRYTNVAALTEEWAGTVCAGPPLGSPSEAQTPSPALPST
jgi:hypothetical protein